MHPQASPYSHPHQKTTQWLLYNSSGKHHFQGTNLMQQLLENEGIVVVDNQIQDLETIFWDPMKELS